MKPRTLLTTAALIAAALFILDVPAAYGESAGDYKTDTAGAWGAEENWQRHNGTDWVDAPDYPGESSPLGVVTVDHAMTVAVADAAAGTLNVNSTVTINGGGTVTLSGAVTHTIDGTININATSAQSYGTLAFSTNSQIVSGTGDIDGHSNYARFSITSAVTVTIGGTCEVHGSMEICADGRDSSGGTLDNDWFVEADDNGGTLTLYDGTFSGGSGTYKVAIAGATLNFASGVTAGSMSAAFYVGPGTLDIDDDDVTTTLNAALDFYTGGKIEVASGGKFEAY